MPACRVPACRACLSSSSRRAAVPVAPLFLAWQPLPPCPAPPFARPRADDEAWLPAENGCSEVWGLMRDALDVLLHLAMLSFSGPSATTLVVRPPLGWPAGTTAAGVASGGWHTRGPMASANIWRHTCLSGCCALAATAASIMLQLGLSAHRPRLPPPAAAVVAQRAVCLPHRNQLSDVQSRGNSGECLLRQ